MVLLRKHLVGLIKPSSPGAVLLTGLIAKGLGFCNQIGSTYLLAAAWGSSGLKLQMVAISFVSWFYLLLFGMQTSLPTLLISARDDTRLRTLYIQSAFVAAFLCALVALTVSLSVRSLSNTSTLSEAPVLAAAACNALLLFFSLSEQVYYADQKAAKFNLLNGAGSFLSLASASVLATLHGGESGFIIAYYTSMLFPAMSAGCLILSENQVWRRRELHQLRLCTQRLLLEGRYGLGYSVSLYCKTQAPLLILDVMEQSDDIAKTGLSLRFAALVYSSASIFFPVLFTRIGFALKGADYGAYSRWRLVGLALTGIASFFVAVISILFGQKIFEIWTGGAVSLEPTDCLALATFSVALLVQYVLLSVTAPDTVATARLQWLYWLEAVFVVVAAILGAHLHGGSGLLAGMSMVMSSSIFVVLLVIEHRKNGLEVASKNLSVTGKTG
jgi:hypothetical protein